VVLVRHLWRQQVDGTDCVISGDIGQHLKTTVASKTIAHLTTPVTEWVFTFPELLLPSIEEVEYSFVAASEAEPWAQHRAVKGKNGTSVLVQTSAATRCDPA